MVIVSLVVPLSMVLIGYYFSKKPPKTINRYWGYRTNRSMQNENTWVFAHQFIGKLWFKIGIVIMFLTIVFMGSAFNLDVDGIAYLSLGVTLIQVVCMVFPIALTEKALKARFK